MPGHPKSYATGSLTAYALYHSAGQVEEPEPVAAAAVCAASHARSYSLHTWYLWAVQQLQSTEDFADYPDT